MLSQLLSEITSHLFEDLVFYTRNENLESITRKTMRMSIPNEQEKNFTTREITEFLMIDRSGSGELAYSITGNLIQRYLHTFIMIYYDPCLGVTWIHSLIRYFTKWLISPPWTSVPILSRGHGRNSLIQFTKVTYDKRTLDCFVLYVDLLGRRTIRQWVFVTSNS